MEVMELLTGTRSARKSLDLENPADLAVVQECLRIGLHAANGSNLQSWRWLVISDRERRNEIARCYREAYLSMTSGQMVAESMQGHSPMEKLMRSTEWLVEHLAQVPLLVIPCYQPFVPRSADDDLFYQSTLYGSIFPAVWNFQLALHTRHYGTCITTLHLHRANEIRALLGIPESYVQGCLLPVARLRAGVTFHATPRRAVEEVVALDGWDGPPLVPPQ
jgi:nitroreductase